VPLPNPQNHNDFFSHNGELKLNIPLIFDEHESTGITVFALSSGPSNNHSFVTVQISASGPLVLKEVGNEKEHQQIKKNIATQGNDAFHIQTPTSYKFPSGKEGDCLAQANILLRKLEMINGQEVASDSLSIDLYIKRKLVNVLKSTWKSLNGWILNIGSSALITVVMSSFVTYFFGKGLAELFPSLVVMFVSIAFVISVIYSWYIRDTIIKKRLNCNNMYLELMRRV
jgi:hypothetical protein